MPGVVFTETLRRNRRSALFWAIGIAAMSALVVVTTPDVAALKEFAALVASMPPFLINGLIGGDTVYMATPEGFLVTKFFSFALLIYAVYALLAGLNVISNDEDRRRLDLVLSLPLVRWRVVLEPVLAYGLLIALMVGLNFAALALAVALTPALHVDTLKLLNATFNILPGALLVLTFTTLASALLRNRGAAVAAATIFVVASYFVDFIGASASGTLAASLRGLSFFYYYDGVGVMKNGLEWGNILLVLAAALICTLVSLWGFARRDIGV